MKETNHSRYHQYDSHDREGEDYRRSLMTAAETMTSGRMTTQKIQFSAIRDVMKSRLVEAETKIEPGVLLEELSLHSSATRL